MALIMQQMKVYVLGLNLLRLFLKRLKKLLRLIQFQQMNILQIDDNVVKYRIDHG